MVDLTEVSFSPDGTFSTQHLALTRICSSVIHAICAGVLVSSRRRDRQVALNKREAPPPNCKFAHKYTFFALLFHVVALLASLVITLGGIGRPYTISKVGHPGYKLMMFTKVSRVWTVVGHRKCSLIRIVRFDSIGKSTTLTV